jgi:hypothetical protein
METFEGCPSPFTRLAEGRRDPALFLLAVSNSARRLPPICGSQPSAGGDVGIPGAELKLRGACLAHEAPELDLKGVSRSSNGLQYGAVGKFCGLRLGLVLRSSRVNSVYHVGAAIGPQVLALVSPDDFALLPINGVVSLHAADDAVSRGAVDEVGTGSTGHGALAQHRNRQ